MARNKSSGIKKKHEEEKSINNGECRKRAQIDRRKM